MFYPLITPTFTPSCLSVVVLLLVALLLYSSESCWDWSYFMLRLPGPQFENSCVSVFTHSCHMARSAADFCLLLLFLSPVKASCGAFCLFWQIGHMKWNVKCQFKNFMKHFFLMRYICALKNCVPFYLKVLTNRVPYLVTEHICSVFSCNSRNNHSHFCFNPENDKWKMY